MSSFNDKFSAYFIYEYSAKINKEIPNYQKDHNSFFIIM